MEEVRRSLALFRPELALTAGLLLVVLIDAARPRWRDGINGVLTVLTLIAALVLCGSLRGASSETSVTGGLPGSPRWT